MAEGFESRNEQKRDHLREEQECLAVLEAENQWFLANYNGRLSEWYGDTVYTTGRAHTPERIKKVWR